MQLKLASFVQNVENIEYHKLCDDSSHDKSVFGFLIEVLSARILSEWDFSHQDCVGE